MRRHDHRRIGGYYQHAENFHESESEYSFNKVDGTPHLLNIITFHAVFELSKRRWGGRNFSLGGG